MTPAVTNQTINLAGYRNHPLNYNGHSDAQISKLMASLSKFGQIRSIVVWREYIIAGHGLTEAAKRLGWKTLRADVLDSEISESVALAYLVADNELARQSDPDQAALAAILDQVKQADAELVTAAGFSEQELAELLASLEPADADEWSAGLDGLPTEDKAPFQQMTFTLHDSQAEQVKRAIGAAGKLGDFADSPNQNGNGNALAFICETFVTEHGQS